MTLLRQLLGDRLRSRRLAQHRTLRDVSAAARVSLGYLSEIERGHKEASSELLAAICTALDLPMSTVLREVSDDLAVLEAAGRAVLPVGFAPAGAPAAPAAPTGARATAGALPAHRVQVTPRYLPATPARSPRLGAQPLRHRRPVAPSAQGVAGLPGVPVSGLLLAGGGPGQPRLVDPALVGTAG